MIRPVGGEEWVALAEVVKRETGARFYRDMMSVPPEEAARLSYWKRLRYYYRRSWRMAFVFSGRASRRECLSVFLPMTLADCLGLVVVQILLGCALPFLIPGVDVFSCLSFISKFLGPLFRSDTWGMSVEHAGGAGAMAAGGIAAAIFVLSGTWVVVLLGLFPGTKKENQYGHPPEV